jgi:Trk K+ transport system NAD-binding subunit
MAAIDPCVVGSFFVGDDLMLTVEIRVAPGSRLAEMTTTELMSQGRFAILAHEREHMAQRALNPSDSIELAPGDHLVAAMPREDLPRFHALNRSAERRPAD